MESRPKKLLDQVRDAIRVKHYARNTEQAYVYWIKKYIVWQLHAPDGVYPFASKRSGF